MKGPWGEELRCSFCHKTDDVVGKIIASAPPDPRAYICDECIAVCNSILEENNLGKACGAQTAGGGRGSHDPPGSIEVVLQPDVAEAFPDSDSVNTVLRQLMAIARRSSP